MSRSAPVVMTLSKSPGTKPGTSTRSSPCSPSRPAFSSAGAARSAPRRPEPNWATPDSEDEGYFITAILNAEEARRRIETLQSRGLFGARDFDKVMFTLPIPRFSAASALHRDLAAAGREAEALAAAIAIPEATPFARARRMVRDHLRAHGVSDRIDGLVARLLDGDAA